MSETTEPKPTKNNIPASDGDIVFEPQKNSLVHESTDEPDSYIDKGTGYTVFTRAYHLKRGYCCKSVCRHCPWNYGR